MTGSPSTSSAASNLLIPALTAQKFGQIPEIGLPDGRGVAIQSALNTSISSAQNLNTLKGGQLFNGTVSAGDTQDFYRFDVRDTKNWGFLLSGLTTGAKLSVVNTATGAVARLTAQGDGTTQYLTGSLRPGSYALSVSGENVTTTSSYRLSLLEGNTYFVSTTGQDNSLGTYAAPFATIEAAAKRLDPGDTVMIRGGVYYDRILELSRSGSIDRPVTIESVPGEFVAVDHGFKTGEWVPTRNSNVFRTKPIIAEPDIDRIDSIIRVVIDNKPLVQVASRGALVEGSFWVDRISGDLYSWAAGGGNPTGKEVLVLARRDSGTSSGVRLLDASYVTIDGLSLRAGDIGILTDGILTEGLGEAGIRSKGITVRNSEVKFTWNYGIRLDDTNNALIENNNVHDNAQINFPRNQKGIWPHAIIGYNTSDIIVKGNRIHNNNGEGVGPYLGSDRWQILNNVVYDNWSVNVYVDTNLGDVTVDGNLIYNTGKYSGQPKDRSDGVRIANELADYDNTDPTPGVYGIRVTNNIIIGTNSGISSFAYEDGPSYLSNSIIANNTIGPVLSDTDAIYVKLGDNVQVLNNLVTTNPILLGKGIGAGIIARNNGVANAAQVLPSGENVSITETKVADLNLILGTGFLAENYAAIVGSIWYGAGSPVPGLAKDFRGNDRNALNPSIGAFEGPIVIPIPDPTPVPDPTPTPDPTPVPVVIPEPIPEPAFKPTALAKSIAARLRYGR